MLADVRLCAGGREFMLTMNEVDHAEVRLWVWMRILAKGARETKTATQDYRMMYY